MHTFFMSCPYFNTSRLRCRSGVYPEWHFTLLHRGPARPLPLPTEHAAHAPACWSLVTGQSRTPVTSCTGCGVCTHSPNDAESARLWTVQQHTVWPEERGVAARLVTSSSGRTSRPGDPRPNPQGAGTDGPCCLLSTACLSTNSTLRRETCEDRHARLPCGGDAVPEV